MNTGNHNDKAVLIDMDDGVFWRNRDFLNNYRNAEPQMRQRSSHEKVSSSSQPFTRTIRQTHAHSSPIHLIQFYSLCNSSRMSNSYPGGASLGWRELRCRYGKSPRERTLRQNLHWERKTRRQNNKPTDQRTIERNNFQIELGLDWIGRNNFRSSKKQD